MWYGIDLGTLGRYAEPGVVLEVAREAEAAGWEALFVWDHLAPSAYAAAGATWRLENIHRLRGSPESMLARVRTGPPR